jgi:hypothetical protein
MYEKFTDASDLQISGYIPNQLFYGMIIFGL